MTEYSREQRNQLSRAIANSGSQSKQLKAFVDNRYISIMPLQKKGVTIGITSRLSTDKITGESGNQSGINNVNFPGVIECFYYKKRKNEYVIENKYKKLKEENKKLYYDTPRTAKQCAEPHALSKIWARDLQSEDIKGQTKESWLQGIRLDKQTNNHLWPCAVCHQWIYKGYISHPEKIELVGEIPKKETKEQDYEGLDSRFGSPLKQSVPRLYSQPDPSSDIE